MNQEEMVFRPFKPDFIAPDNMRLCYIYSDSIPKEQAHIAQWDEESSMELDCTGWYSIERDEWLSYDDTEGLHWAHLPLPSDYQDDGQRPEPMCGNCKFWDAMSLNLGSCKSQKTAIEAQPYFNSFTGIDAFAGIRYSKEFSCKNYKTK